MVIIYGSSHFLFSRFLIIENIFQIVKTLSTKKDRLSGLVNNRNDYSVTLIEAITAAI